MIGDFIIQVYIIPYIHGPDLHVIFMDWTDTEDIYIYTVVLQKSEESSRTEQNRIGDPSAQIFRWTFHFSGNIDKFKNIFVSLNTVVIKYQKLLIYLVSFKYLKHLYHFATMVTGCVAISQRND